MILLLLACAGGVDSAGKAGGGGTDDPGETAAPADSADTPDSADTADSADPADSADTADTGTEPTDADGDGYSAADGDCDDTRADVSPASPELDNLRDDDCDALVDEDFLAEGALVLTELAQLPVMGGDALVPSAQWFEVYNPDPARTVRLDGMTIETYYESFLVDPAAAVAVPPQGFVVVCATADWVGAAGATHPLACDYTWDRAAPYGAPVSIGDDHDLENTLAIRAGSTWIAWVQWSWWADTPEPWPYAEGLTLSLDPTLPDPAEVTSWCLAPASAGHSWWTDGAAVEVGTPGGRNDPCPE